MTRFILLTALIGTLLLAGVETSTAQTNPGAYNLASGNYSFTSWASSSPAGTYPTSMIFHVFDRRIEPFEGSIQDLPKADWGQVYNLTGGARINGDDANGMSFLQTSSANSGNCGYPGEAILALSTSGRANVAVSFVSQVTAAGTRPYNLRLQYRIGTSGNWINAIGSNGDYVQLVSATDGTSPKAFSWTMPSSLENQSYVQVRWIYFQDGDGSGTRPRIRLDDIFVTSDSPTAAPATALKVMSVTPKNPTVNTPFTVVVRPVSGTGAVSNLSTTTTIRLTVASGSGSIIGTTTAVIPAGSNIATLSNVSWNTVTTGASITASVLSGQALTAGTSNVFDVVSAPSYAVMTGPWHQAWTGYPMNPIKITVYRPDNTVDVNYFGTITFSVVSGPALSGASTVSVQAVRGVAEFTNLIFSGSGNASLQFNLPGLPAQTLPTITVVPSPNLTTNYVPQYMMSSVQNGCNFSAYTMPFYSMVTFTGLQPNTTYRYITGASNVYSTMPTSTGGGQNVHLDNGTMTYSYTGGKSLESNYSKFATGPGQTSKVIWINIVPTNNLTFAYGNTIYWQVSLGDHHGNLIRTYQLNQTSLALPAGNVATTGTLVGDKISQLHPKNIVLIWDNTAGSGRPIGSALVQSHNTTVNYTTNAYANDIQNVDGAWMSYIPNTIGAGIRRIEERDAVTGQLVYSSISTDGMWNDISTNPLNTAQYPAPGGEDNPIYINTPYITISSPAAGDTLCSGVPFDIVFRACGMKTVKIEYSVDGGSNYTLIDDNVTVDFNANGDNDDNGDYSDEYGIIAPPLSTAFTWVPPSIGFRGNCLIRITGVDRPNESRVSGKFTIVEPLTVIGELDHRNLCLGDNDTLIALVGGTAESYRWYKDGELIPNVNSPLLFINNAHFNTSGVYWCEVNGYGACGDVVTNKATLRVGRKTQIVNQTTAVAGIIGETATMSVEVEFPDEAQSYQWFRGQTELTESRKYYGTKSNRLEIRNFSNADYGNDYYCVIDGVCQSAQSRVIRVFPTGVFTEFSKSSIDACAGGTVSVPAMAYSNPPGQDLVIEWFKNGQRVNDDASYSGSNSATLMFNNVSATHAGEYTVRVSLASNRSVTSEATISVNIAPPAAISQQPASTDVCPADSTILSVAVSGGGNVTYQWKLNGTPIPGATSNEYKITNMAAVNAGEYTVSITSACGDLNSSAATVTMKAATAITTQPAATVEVAAGETLELTVEATGAGTVQYQWLKDGTAITGQIAPTFTKANFEAADAGEYWCEVTAECGSVTSEKAVVTEKPTSGVNESIVGDAVVSRIFPNPSTTAATISVAMATTQPVTVKVLNLAGDVVLEAFNGVLNPGENRIPVLTGSLTSGVYTIQTVIGGFSNTQQMVVLH